MQDLVVGGNSGHNVEGATDEADWADETDCVVRKYDCPAILG
jgi:hypothetical protein